MVLDTIFYVVSKGCEDDTCSITNYLLTSGSYYVAYSTTTPTWEIGDTPKIRLVVKCDIVSAPYPEIFICN